MVPSWPVVQTLPLAFGLALPFLSVLTGFVVGFNKCVYFWCTAKRFSHIYIYTHTLFFTFFPIMIYLRLLTIVPSSVQYSLVFIYPVYNRLPLITPNSQSLPPLPATSFSGNHSSECDCESLCLIDRSICVIVYTPYLNIHVYIYHVIFIYI